MELASGLCEEYLSFSNRKTNFLIRKWGKDLKRNAMEDVKVKLGVFFYWTSPYLGGRLSQGTQDSLFQLDLLASKPAPGLLSPSVGAGVRDVHYTTGDWLSSLGFGDPM